MKGGFRGSGGDLPDTLRDWILWGTAAVVCLIIFALIIYFSID